MYNVNALINFQPPHLISVDDSADLSVFTNDISSNLHSNELLQNLCAGYGYNFDVETISEVIDDVFLQEYATKCGYQLTEDFLSIMNGYKLEFIDKVDSIISVLSSSFSFFFEDLESDIKNLIYLINKASYSFSRRVYRLRPKCIDVLRSDIIPLAIKSIFDSKVINGSSERRMTYCEMERFFLYFVSILEKFIMGRIMKYWRDFCNNIKGALPEHSNPFACAYHFYRVSTPNIYCPASFTNKFGECISFMAVAKIEEIMGCLVVNLGNELKKIVSSKCYYICNYGSDVVSDLEKLRDNSLNLIKEEFDKKIIECGIKDNFSNFLKKIFTWIRPENTKINKVPIIDKIIEVMRDLLVSGISSNIRRIISRFKRRLLSSKRRSLIGGKYLCTIEDRWNLKLHPEDSSKILAIKRKFTNKYRDVVYNKFCVMLRDGHKFLDGTVIDTVDWDKISKNLFPIAQETVRHLVASEHEELSRFLSNARVIEYVDIFEDSSASARKITSEEIEKVLKISVDSLHSKNRYLFSLLWKSLINSKKDNTLKDTGFHSESGECEKVIPSSSTQNELPVITPMSADLLGKRDKIIDMWGLNLHPDDNKLILFIRRKFSNQIVDYLTKLFSCMLKNRTVLPSGIVLSGSSWSLISRELSGIALESLGPIVENQYAELDVVLSKARVVDVNESDFSSCIIRKITDDEKKEIVTCVKNLIYRRLSASIRKSWLCVVNKSSIDVGYGYKEKSKYISGRGREGTWGVKLRYSDNTALLKIRRKFSSNIRVVVRSKFSNMLENKYKFDDGTFIAAFAWPRVCRKIIPIIKEEIKPILEDQRVELEGVISRARVVVDPVDREITCEEKLTVLEKVMNAAYHALKILFRKAWDDVITSVEGNFIDIKDYTVGSECMVGVSSSSVNVVVDSHCKNDNLNIKLCHEYDYAILNVRRKFSFEICNFIRESCSRIIEENIKFDDGTDVVKCNWGKVSKRVFPIINKEISPILEKERGEISDILLRSRVDVSPPDSDTAIKIIVRDITCEERLSFLENVMQSVLKQVIRKSGQIWNKLVKLSLAGFKDLSDECRLEFDNIRLEFIGSLGLVVKEIVDSSESDAYNIISERSHSLFNEGGFLSRVELLLSEAKVVDIFGKHRFITDEEKKCVLKEFIDMIGDDRECLIKRRASLKN